MVQKIIFLIIFHVFILVLLFLLLKSNFTKEKRMYEHYEHISYIIIHVYEYLCILCKFIHIHTCYA